MFEENRNQSTIIKELIIYLLERKKVDIDFNKLKSYLVTKLGLELDEKEDIPSKTDRLLQQLNTINENLITTILEAKKEAIPILESTKQLANKKYPEGTSVGDDDKVIELAEKLDKEYYSFVEAEKLTGFKRQTISSRIKKGNIKPYITKSGTKKVPRIEIIKLYREFHGYEQFEF